MNINKVSYVSLKKSFKDQPEIFGISVNRINLQIQLYDVNKMKDNENQKPDYIYNDIIDLMNDFKYIQKVI